ncbi:TRAM domain-containing protein [Nocardia vulneris]|uniref:TRAM domain-containing protein n=1 Tax=Nocardia vulneris TaxID=1141657 RepID=UPI003BAF8272
MSDWQRSTFEVRLGPPGHGGFCVARHEGRVVFVRHGLPGELVRVRVTEDRGGSFCRADAIEIREASPDRVPATCPVSGPGGAGCCDFSFATPTAQRALKASVVAEQLRRLAGIEREVVVEPITGAGDVTSGWRTRIRLAVDASGRAGVHRYRSTEVIPDLRCPQPISGALDGVADRLWTPGADLVIAVDGDGVRHIVELAPADRGRPESQDRRGRDRRGRRSTPDPRESSAEWDDPEGRSGTGRGDSSVAKSRRRSDGGTDASDGRNATGDRRSGAGASDSTLGDRPGNGRGNAFGGKGSRDGWAGQSGPGEGGTSGGSRDFGDQSGAGRSDAFGGAGSRGGSDRRSGAGGGRSGDGRADDYGDQSGAEHGDAFGGKGSRDDVGGRPGAGRGSGAESGDDARRGRAGAGPGGARGRRRPGAIGGVRHGGDGRGNRRPESLRAEAGELRDEVRYAADGRLEGPQAQERRSASARRAATHAARDEWVVAGSGRAVEYVSGRRWEVAATGFWQAHHGAAQCYSDLVAEWSGLLPGGLAWDLYSGAGVFAARLADQAGLTGAVFAVESARPAVAAGKAALRDLTWLEQHAQRVERWVADRIDAAAPDVVVLDPPRAGAGKEVIRALTTTAPTRIIHIGCDPASFARDLGLYQAAGYRLADLRAFDAFPGTHHVECVALLDRP